MWSYGFLVLTIMVSILSLYKKIKNHKEVDMLNIRNISKLGNRSDVQVATDEKRMTYLLVTIGVLAVMLFWMKDTSDYRFVKCISVFLLSTTLGELVLSQQKYSLYYNAHAFVYRGRYFKNKDIRAVGYSKLFFQPGKLYLQNGQSYICFKKGCDTVQGICRN